MNSIYAEDNKNPLSSFCKLDDFVKDKGISKKIHYLKIDVEGHELSVLQGALKTISVNKPFIEMEINSVTMTISETNVEEIFQLLKKLGYKAFYKSSFSKETNENDPVKIQEFNISNLYDGTLKGNKEIPFNFDAFFIHQDQADIIKNYFNGSKLN